MARATKVFAAVFLPLLLSGCEGDHVIVLGPTPADQGIVIFLHTDFRGPSQALNVDVPDLTRTEGPCSSGAEGEMPSWCECISSIHVLPGWSAILYRDEDFKGRSVTVTSDTPDLRRLPGPCDGSFNDCVSSIRVTRK
jgi:hypothetical protein